MEQIKDKIAVITGGNSGIGYATAMKMKTQGAKVIITGRRAEALEIAAEKLGVDSILSDQASLDDIEKLVSMVDQKYGYVDILFINAGIGTFSSIVSTSVQQFDELMSINFRGAFFTLIRFIPILKENASVVFLSSNGASMSIPNTAVYSAGKAAINSLAKIAAVELASRKIRVNTVSPGPTLTPILDKEGALDSSAMETLINSLKDQIPLEEIGSPLDVGSLVCYLCSDAARFITGTDFIIDGGMQL